MGGVFAFFAAELFSLQAIRSARFLLGTIVPRAADGAFQPNVFAHKTLNNQQPAVGN
jgi:hypothetical protein